MLPFDLDIFAPSRVIMPCVNRALNGSWISSRPMSVSALTKKRAYSRCRIACSTPPMYWSTGSQRRAVVAGVRVAQEVPRRIDEGVHRVRLAPRVATAAGAGDVQPVLGRSQRRPPLRRVVLDVRQQHREVGLGDGDE